MYSVLIITAVIFFFGVFNGLRKGLIRSIFSTFILIASMAIAAYCGPYAAKFMSTTVIYSNIHDRVETTVAENAREKLDMQVGEQIETINAMPLPESIRSGMVDNNHKDIYDALGVNTFAAYIADYTSMLIINALSYVVVFVLAYILLKLLCLVLDSVAKLPVLNGMNRLGGMILGIVNGALGVWVFYMIITAFSATLPGQLAMNQIQSNNILSFIYNHNYLIELTKNISKIIF